MRLKDRSLSFVINFLLGVAWATVFIGAVSTFLSTYTESFLFALISSVVASLPGMVGVLFIEYFITSKEKYLELQKQTKILEQLIQREQNS
jgi:hypothetical protein